MGAAQGGRIAGGHDLAVADDHGIGWRMEGMGEAKTDPKPTARLDVVKLAA